MWNVFDYIRLFFSSNKSIFLRLNLHVIFLDEQKITCKKFYFIEKKQLYGFHSFQNKKK